MLYLSTLSQTISMVRNQPHVVTFTAADQDGAPVSLAAVTGAYLFVSLSTFQDQPWPWFGVAPSFIKRYTTGFVLGGAAITFEFTQELLGQFPLGTFIYEFGVTEDPILPGVEEQYIVVQQGQIILAPSLWVP